MQSFSRVTICGIDTSKLPKFSSKEIMRLITEIKNGNESAKEEFIYANLRLVLSVVQRFLHRGATADDLFQVGCLGLIKAVKNFDLSHNVQFSTYAVPMVIECRNPRKDFESYDQKNRIITGNFATLRGPKEYRDLRETQRHFRRYAADQLD